MSRENNTFISQDNNNRIRIFELPSTNFLYFFAKKKSFPTIHEPTWENLIFPQEWRSICGYFLMVFLMKQWYVQNRMCTKTKIRDPVYKTRCGCNEGGLVAFNWQATKFNLILKKNWDPVIQTNWWMIRRNHDTMMDMKTLTWMASEH